MYLAVYTPKMEQAMSRALSVKAPGRICFFGDHQDYLGLPVIAATIDRYIYMEASPKVEKTLSIELLDLEHQEIISLDENFDILAPRDYFRSVIRVLKRAGIHLQQGYHVKIHGDIPIEAGLSSSSAIVVAWVRLLLKLAQPQHCFSDEQIAQWSYTAEVLEFNEPGGLMDQYTIALGGMVCLNTITGNHQRLSAPWESVIIGDSGMKKSTLGVLSHAKDKALEALEIVKTQYPSFQIERARKTTYLQTEDLLPPILKPYWYAAIHNHLITQDALSLLNQFTIKMKKLGQLINAHQTILQHQIKNTPSPMIEMMEAASAKGAYGTKIVGSGGGGCFVALCSQDSTTNVIKAIETAGARKAFSVNITSFSNG